MAEVGPCGKRCYASKGEARAAHRMAGFRYRIYFCHECKALHVMNEDKNGGRRTERRIHEGFEE